MLYLAEVQRKTRVLGASKAEFKLIACQRSEQNWASCDEMIQAPDDVGYGAGVLVLVELTANKQVRRHFEASRQLVSILQNFSRWQDKSKSQEEEIEQWKQSLTYQSQELNRREMEMEARQEQLQQMEEDFERLEQQRQEIEAAREEAERLQEEFGRKSQELEGAWAHLNGEMRRLEEQQADMQQSAGLNDEQAQRIQELLDRLSGSVPTTETVREQMNSAFEQLQHEQEFLTQHWQSFESDRSASQQQQEIDQQTDDVRNRWHQWHEAQTALEQLRAELQVQQHSLILKQEYLQTLNQQLQRQSELRHEVCCLTDSAEALGDKVDLDALEKMPIDQLQSLAQDLQKGWEKDSKFVSSQEEELRYKQEDIDALRSKINEASEYDRLQIEAELKDEQDAYEMLNETLVGQRRNLREREAVLTQHQKVLARRQGLPMEEGEQVVDIQPLLAQIDTAKQQLEERISEVENQVQDLENVVAQTQGSVDQQAHEQESQRDELKQLEEELKIKRAEVAQVLGRMNLYESMLQPVQDDVDGVKQRLDSIAEMVGQFQEASDYQLQAIAEMQQTISQITGAQSPELAAS